MEKVLKFINDFKQINPKIVEILFYCSYSYWFAVILSLRFNESIYYLPVKNHFITKIDNMYYDINGIYKPQEQMYLWPEEYKNFNSFDFQRVYQQYVNKEY